MISFPLWLALIPFGLVLIFVFLMSLLSIYHMLRFGETTGISFWATFVYLAGTVFILFFTFEAVSTVDWNLIVEVSSIIPAPNPDVFTI